MHELTRSRPINHHYLHTITLMLTTYYLLSHHHYHSHCQRSHLAGEAPVSAPREEETAAAGREEVRSVGQIPRGICVQSLHTPQNPPCHPALLPYFSNSLPLPHYLSLTPSLPSLTLSSPTHCTLHAHSFNVELRERD
jgi:hypothetical protein